VAPVRRPRLSETHAPEWDALERITVLLPVGSTEQHGPHLPMGTDTTIALAICEAACARSDTLIAAPPIPYAVSHHHKRLPGGAISTGTEPFVRYLVAVVSDLLDPHRGRAVLIVNGHGGNWSSITYALDELGATRGELPIAACSWWQLIPEVITDAGIGEQSLVGHAGAIETSVMLNVDADAVDLGRAPPGSRSQHVEEGVHRWVDLARHFSDGVIGVPREAQPELGARLIEAAAERLVDVAARLQAEPLA